MRMTKDTEKKLIPFLQKETISVPELQDGLKISYSEARNLIDYCLHFRWIQKCTSGIDYPVVEKKTIRQDISVEGCKEIWNALNSNEIMVLCFLGNNFNATVEEIASLPFLDESDVREAMDGLIAKGLAFQNDSYYYCTISKKSVEIIHKFSKEKTPLGIPFEGD